MKRKKWSESEELTLLNKYSDLLTSGALAKLKTREKKFKPIADYVNSLHHLQNPINYPFKWSWRDVSIKVHNMRHQYLGVKQKIRIPNGDFNWNDGEDHWENFLRYKEVFGDVELETKSHSDGIGNDINRRFSVGGGEFGDEGAAAELFGENGVMGLEVGMESEEMEDEEDEDAELLGEKVGLGINENGYGRREDTEDSSFDQTRKLHKGLGGKKLRMLGAQVLELRDVMLKREIKRKEREWSKEDVLIMDRDQRRKESRDFERDEKMEMREIEFEERLMAWARKEYDRLEKEIDEEKRRRIKMEEKWEEEKTDLREKMIGMQIEYEKQMTQMYANFCQNQSQVLGIVSRLLNQSFGNAGGGLGLATLGNFPSPVLQNLQHNGGLGDNVSVLHNLQHNGGLEDNIKPPEGSSPSEFL